MKSNDYSMESKNGFIMEKEMTVFLIQHLLANGLKSRKALAAALEIPYRTLLRVSAGHGDKRSITQVTSHVLRYCIKNKIPLDKAIEQFH